MTAKPKTQAQQDPLVAAITQKLAEQDEATRLDRATAIDSKVFDAPAPATQSIGMELDPGERAIGMTGILFDGEIDSALDVVFNTVAVYHDGYYGIRPGGAMWQHFLSLGSDDKSPLITLLEQM